jgi:hypothetical protein
MSLDDAISLRQGLAADLVDDFVRTCTQHSVRANPALCPVYIPHHPTPAHHTPI